MKVYAGPEPLAYAPPFFVTAQAKLSVSLEPAGSVALPVKLIAVPSGPDDGALKAGVGATFVTAIVFVAGALAAPSLSVVTRVTT